MGIEVGVRLGDLTLPARFGGGDDSVSVPAQRYAAWLGTVPAVETDSPVLAGAVARAIEDLGALRIFDPDHPELPVAAGAPWFMTVFAAIRCSPGGWGSSPGPTWPAGPRDAGPLPGHRGEPAHRGGAGQDPP